MLKRVSAPRGGLQNPSLGRISSRAHPGTLVGSRLGRSHCTAHIYLRNGRYRKFLEQVNWISALRAARQLPLSDPSRCLLIGHSEGGVVVARVAAEYPFVTHVASLAGGGPTQLFDAFADARAGNYDCMKEDPDKQVAKLLADVAAIRSDPDNPDKFYFGHPYRYWSSFWSSSPLEELLRTDTRIFIAQGTAEGDVALTGFDVLYATLLAHGRPVTTLRIQGADHGFHFADQPGRDWWKEIFEDVRNWFLE